MSARMCAAMAYGGLAATLIAAAVAGGLMAVRASEDVDVKDISTVNEIGILLAAFAFAAVGAVILLRARGNRVGWFVSAMGPIVALNILAQEYAIYAVLARPDPLLGGATAAWIQSWTSGVPVTLALSLLLLIFPSGKLLGRRWRVVAYTAVVGFLLVFSGAFMYPKNTTAAFESIRNPYGFDSAGDIALVVAAIGWLLSLLALLAAAIGEVVRFRRASGIERQQIKWLASAGTLLAVGFAVSTFYGNAFTEAASTATYIAIPLAAGIAILRYRLYEIDVVVNRTLVYGSLTALLAGAYVGLVLLFQLALHPLTGGSGLAIALSTLAVAALFRPARAKIQALVDRRFYRRKYDAARTLEAFAARLREEVDLDALRAELTGVVAETMQPAHVSVWLRAAPGPVTPAVTIRRRLPSTKEAR